MFLQDRFIKFSVTSLFIAASSIACALPITLTIHNQTKPQQSFSVALAKCADAQPNLPNTINPGDNPISLPANTTCAFGLSDPNGIMISVGVQYTDDPNQQTITVTNCDSPPSNYQCNYDKSNITITGG